jgi:hypothetical protein
MVGIYAEIALINLMSILSSWSLDQNFNS